MLNARTSRPCVERRERNSMTHYPKRMHRSASTSSAGARRDCLRSDGQLTSIGGVHGQAENCGEARANQPEPISGMFGAPQAADLTSRTMWVAQWPKILGDVPRLRPDAGTETRGIAEIRMGLITAANNNCRALVG